MSNFEALKILGFDHLEFAVADIERAAESFLKLGFEKAGMRELRERELRSLLLVQNEVQIVLSHSTKGSDPIAAFVKAHGDGILNIAFRCEDAVSALEIAASRGATVLEPPRSYQKEAGTVHQAAIAAFGDVRHTLISRQGNLFAEGFDLSPRRPNKAMGFQRIDHVTCLVETGKIELWRNFYEKIFGLTSYSIENLTILESPRGGIRLPFCEPSTGGQEIQEHLDMNHGPGVEHAAFSSENLLESVQHWRKQGAKFLGVPSPYYETISKRFPGIVENVHELAEYGIMVDGDENGYLLQVFTGKLMGPFFLEAIQRKGATGFGEKNRSRSSD